MLSKSSISLFGKLDNMKLEAIHSLSPAGRGERSAKYLEAKLGEMVGGGDWMMMEKTFRISLQSPLC